MAGIDGIKNKIEPLAPVDKDLYELPPDEMANIPQVPGSLSEVLGEAADFVDAHDEASIAAGLLRTICDVPLREVLRERGLLAGHPLLRPAARPHAQSSARLLQSPAPPASRGAATAAAQAAAAAEAARAQAAAATIHPAINLCLKLHT
jgi:hypothetical protein